MRPMVSASLAGRARELHQLHAALAEARQGRGSMIVLEGPEGVGRSRLAREAVKTARAEQMATLVGRAWHGARYVPLAPLRGAFRPVYDTIDFDAVADGDADDELVARTAEELALFAPALRHLFEPAGSIADPAEAGLVSAREGLRCLAALAGSERGALVVLDDLHLADAATVDVVVDLARRPGPLGVVWLLVVDASTSTGQSIVALATAPSPLPLLPPGGRSVTTEAPAASSAGNQSDALDVTVIEVAPLGGDAVDEMLAELIGEPPSRSLELDAHRWTRGLPLLVEELARVLTIAQHDRSSDGPVAPADLHEAVATRLRRLEPEAHEAVSLAAIIGEYLDPDLISRTLDRSRRGVAKALTPSVDAGLLSADEMGLRFRHSLLRAATLASLSPDQRSRLACAALDALTSNSSTVPIDPYPDSTISRAVIADLCLLAGRPEAAAIHLIEAGRRALAAGWPRTACDAFERAASEAGPVGRFDALEGACEALLVAGDASSALAVSEQLLEELDEADVPDARRADGALLAARAMWAADADLDHIDRAVDEALDLANPSDSAQLARVERHRAAVAFGSDRIEEGLEAAREAQLHAERARLPGVVCESLVVLGWWLRGDDLERAKGCFKQARAMAEKHGLTAWQIRARYELAVIAQLDQGRFDQLAEARAEALESGALHTLVSLDLRTASLHLNRFEADLALERAAEAAALAERLDFRPQLAAARIAQATAHALRREPAEMGNLIDDGLACAGENVDLLAAAFGEARAIEALLEEERERAMADLQVAMTAVGRLPFVAPFGFHGIWALLHAIADDDDGAAREDLRESGATVFRPNAAYLGLADAIELGRRGRAAEAKEIARRAENDLSRYGGYCHLAMRLAAEPALADEWGSPGVWLRRAATYFEGTGHTKVVAACQARMAEAGISPPDRPRAEADVGGDLRVMGVTRREVEVLDLVAEGLGNTEIGRRLGLSPRTVEKHVASLQAKTGHGNRAQLQAFAADRLAKQHG